MPRLLLIGAAGLACLALSACGTATAVQVVGAAVNAALQTSGLVDKPNGEKVLSVRLETGEALNSTSEGEPLALLVRVYQLRTDAEFSALGYAQFADKSQEEALLGNEVLHVREMMLLPGKTYALEEKLDKDTQVVGVVALFHSPANERWKYAFDTEASDDDGIAIGFHACSMTISAGVLTHPEAAASATTLAGVRCGS